MMDRLTNRKTAELFKEYFEGLEEVGIALPLADKEYIRLAEYENAQEEAEKLCEAMQALIDDGDPERAHCMADDLLCKALNNFGCQKLTELYDKIYKW